MFWLHALPFTTVTCVYSCIWWWCEVCGNLGASSMSLVTEGQDKHTTLQHEYVCNIVGWAWARPTLMHWNVNAPNRWDLGRKSHHIALPMYTRCYLTCANPTMFYIHLVKWWQGLYKIYCTVMGVGRYSPALSYSQNIFVLCRAVEILMPSSWQKARAVYSGRRDRWECEVPHLAIYSGRRDRWECEVPHLHWIPVSDFCKLTGWCPSRSCLYLFCVQYIVPKINVRYTDFSLAFYFRTEGQSESTSFSVGSMF